MSGLKGHSRRLALGFALAAVLLFFFFRGLNWRELADAFRLADVGWLAAVALVSVLVYLVLAWLGGFLRAP